MMYAGPLPCRPWPAFFRRCSMPDRLYREKRRRRGRSDTGGAAYLVLSTIVLTIGMAPDVYLGWWCVPAYVLMFVCIPASGIAARHRQLSNAGAPQRGTV